MSPTPSERPSGPPEPVLRGRYPVRSPLGNLLLRLTDGLLETVSPLRPETELLPPAPGSVLVACLGHRGDGVLATAAFAALRAEWPDCRLGFLGPESARTILAGHPLIGRFHGLDHWKLARGRSWARRLADHLRSRRRCRRELAGEGYEVAVDLGPWYPNAAALVWRAGVPCRAGWTSGGMGALLTHPRTWTGEPRHVVQDHRALLASLGLSREAVSRAVPSLPVDREGPNPAQVLLGPGRYVVLQPGAGSVRRSWPEERWKDVVDGLLAAGLGVALTGAGEGERRLAAAVADGRPGTALLFDDLPWGRWVRVVADAAALVGLDSVAAHVAAAVGTPVVAIFGGINDPRRWAPWSDRRRVLTAPRTCSPCERAEGCPAMSCLREVEAASVVAAALEVVG